MSQLAFWPAPRDEDVTHIDVLRASALGGNYTKIATILALDPYDNWVTHYEDLAGTSGDYYRARYLKGDPVQTVGESPEQAGVTPLQVKPQDVIDSIQGLPLNYVNAWGIQRWIQWAVGMTEKRIRMQLSPTTATQEPHSWTAFSKIFSLDRGKKIRLRHRPLIGVPSKVEYRIRGGEGVQDIELADLDILNEYDGSDDGYNPGVISIYARNSSITGLAGVRFSERALIRAVNVLFTYQHGFVAWPIPLEEAIMKYAAGQVMEIAGQAETAGISSRSLDGYSESFTASATTTQFSALRIEYNKQVDDMIKYYRKPLVG